MLASVFGVTSNIFERIEGIPKQVPNTTEQPTIPLKKGSKTLFPKPTFDSILQNRKCRFFL